MDPIPAHIWTLSVGQHWVVHLSASITRCSEGDQIDVDSSHACMEKAEENNAKFAMFRTDGKCKWANTCTEIDSQKSEHVIARVMNMVERGLTLSPIWVSINRVSVRSGHTGGPMSSSDYAYILYKEFLNFDPNDPDWFNRDRFILSAGHGSMLLYSLLFLCGYKIDFFFCLQIMNLFF